MQFITEVNTIAVDNFDIGYSYNIRFRDDTLKTLVCIGKGVDFVMFQDKYPDLLFSLTMTTAADVDSIEVWSGGTTNYNDLSNKPQINSHTLFGNMSASDLGLVTPSDLSDYVTQDDLDDYVTQDDLDDYATTAAVTAALASKQDVINDLADIRSGAAAGATAVQPAALNDYATTAAVTTALASKQDTLSSDQLSAVNSGIDSTKVDQIETNKNNILSLLPTNFTTPTIATDGIDANLTIVYGGYFKIGNLTIFTLRFTISDTLIKGRWLFEGMPKSAHTTSLNDGASIAPCQIVTVLNGTDTKGTICKKDSTSTGVAIPSTGNDMTAGTYLISGYYLSE